MGYMPITPFRRTLDAAILKHQTAPPGTDPGAGPDIGPVVNKWEVLRELAAARTTFGLSDRDLTLLQTLLSFHPGAALDPAAGAVIVHPSNAAICARLNGMPCSTMRRHLAHLVQAGVILRRDSPNGKRYARRFGDDKLVFGFDLSPLVRRFPEICAAAEAIRAAEDRYKRLRATVSLMRRDLAGLADYGRQVRPDLAIWDQCADLAALTARDLRKKLDLADLARIEVALAAALDRARGTIDGCDTEKMSIKDAQTEQHHQNSNKDLYDLEEVQEKAEGQGTPQDHGRTEVKQDPDGAETANLPSLPLALVLRSCQEFAAYIDGPVRHWHDLVRAANQVRPMMGISPSAWDDAVTHMGPEAAATVLVAMLERFTEIRSPGGYLRSLTAKAADGKFSCGPMIMALLRREPAP